MQFVINYEEGAEHSVLHGDIRSEAFLSEMIGTQPIIGARCAQMESLYEYGGRVGSWRLHPLFEEFRRPVTVFGVAKALAANPEAVRAMQESGWEIASHGLRWIDYQHAPPEVERAHNKGSRGPA